MKLSELAELLGAELQVAATESTEMAETLETLVERVILGVAGLEAAGPEQISFLANRRYAPQAQSTRAAAVLAEPDSPPLPVPTLRIANPYLAFGRALRLFHAEPVYPPGVHPTAVIAPSATLPPDIHIGPYVVVGEGVTLGERTVLLAHVVLYPGVQAGTGLFCHAHAVVREGAVLGSNVVLGNGVVLGGDGFGFARDGKSGWNKLLHAGRVIVGDDVEIQANSCIDRASVGETHIRSGAKIDNLVQVGHGSTVGERTLLCAQVGLAGSTHVGQDVILAGQVGVAGSLTIGNGVIASAQTGIPNDVAAGQMVSGYPAIPNTQWLRSSAAFTRLPELVRRVARLERKVSSTHDDVQ